MQNQLLMGGALLVFLAIAGLALFAFAGGFHVQASDAGGYWAIASANGGANQAPLAQSHAPGAPETVVPTPSPCRRPVVRQTCGSNLRRAGTPRLDLYSPERILPYVR